MVRQRLREASRVAFRRLVDLALEERVDALLIAGDLFDDERLSFQTERFLLEQLKRLDARDVPVVYATGNHDPGRAGLSWRASPLTRPTASRLESSAGSPVRPSAGSRRG